MRVRDALMNKTTKICLISKQIVISPNYSWVLPSKLQSCSNSMKKNKRFSKRSNCLERLEKPSSLRLKPKSNSRNSTRLTKLPKEHNFRLGELLLILSRRLRSGSRSGSRNSKIKSS